MTTKCAHNHRMGPCSQNQVLAVILSASSSSNPSILFRYPCGNSAKFEENGGSSDAGSHNNFAVKNSHSYYEITNQFHQLFGIGKNGLITYSDKVLSPFLAVQSMELANKPFDVKVDDVQFVGYPVSVRHSQIRKKGKDPNAGSRTIVNVVFALPVVAIELSPLLAKSSSQHIGRSAREESVSESSKACFHQLSQQVAMAIKHEESRCCYFCSQRKLMERIIEDFTPHTEAGLGQTTNHTDAEETHHPSLVMLERGFPLSLPSTLKNIFEKVSESGIVLELMNNWTEINFCLPIKSHNLPFDTELCITEEDIDRCLDLIRPYHAMLLLVDARTLIKSLPIDSSPALVRLLRVCSPTKNLQELAADSDLELSQVFKLVKHLVYWAKATVIYPLCEPNVYVLSPNAPTFLKSHVVNDFNITFPEYNLTETLSEFSLPLQLDEHRKITDDQSRKSEKLQIVIWMLKNRLLVQLHTYLYLKPAYCEMEVFTSGKGILLNDEGREQLSMVSDHNESEAGFTKLLRYFDGTQHIEDIMYNENMTRTSVSTIVNKFMPMIYTMQVADPATSYYAKVS